MKLHHRVDGPSDAPPLVLSSSLGTTHALWDGQAPALAERFRVVRYDRRGHGRSPVPAGPYSLDDLGGDVLETPAEGYAGCCEALADVDLGDRLGEIRAPTLVLSGEADTVAPPERGDELASGIPGARHETLPDSGHLANVERPDLFTELVLTHLTEETP